MKMAEVSSRGAQQVDVWKEKDTSFAACAEKLTVSEERVSQGARYDYGGEMAADRRWSG